MSGSAVASEAGATAVEYSIMAAAIAAVIVAVVFAIGVATQQEFDGTCSAIAVDSGGSMNCTP